MPLREWRSFRYATLCRDHAATIAGRHTVKKWEYRQVQQFISDEDLNAYGKLGWELGSFSMTESRMCYLFKRPL